MKIAKRCKGCGEVVEVDSAEFPRERPVLDGNQTFWLRFWFIAALGASLLAGIIAWSVVQETRIISEAETQMMKDPTMKIEIQELPGQRAIRKFTREVK